MAFLWLQRAGPASSCGEGLSHCGAFSRRGAGAPGRRRRGCGTGALWLCDMRIFLGQGLNPRPLHWQADSYSLDHQDSPLRCLNYPIHCIMGFSHGSDSKASVCNVGDPGSIPGSGRSPGEGNGNPLQCSCLENPMDGRAW